MHGVLDQVYSDFYRHDLTSLDVIVNQISILSSSVSLSSKQISYRKMHKIILVLEFSTLGALSNSRSTEHKHYFRLRHNYLINKFT